MGVVRRECGVGEEGVWEVVRRECGVGEEGVWGW